jgi:hypothetical protein
MDINKKKSTSQDYYFKFEKNRFSAKTKKKGREEARIRGKNKKTHKYKPGNKYVVYNK